MRNPLHSGGGGARVSGKLPRLQRASGSTTERPAPLTMWALMPSDASQRQAASNHVAITRAITPTFIGHIYPRITPVADR